MRKLIAALLCMLTPVVAGAGSSTGGSARSIIFTNDGHVIFWSTGARQNRPACAADNRWVFNATTPGGQVMLTGLMAGYPGRSMVIVGTGTCSWEGETVAYFYFDEVIVNP